MSNVSTDSPISTPSKHTHLPPRTPWKENKHQYESPFSTPSKNRVLRQAAATPKTPPKAAFSALPFADSPLKQPLWRYVAPSMTFKETDPSESRRAGLTLTEDEAVDVVKKMASLVQVTPSSLLFRAEREGNDEKEQRNNSGQSGDEEEERIVDPFPLSIFDSLIKQNLRILKYINSVDHFYSLFVPFYDHRMNTEWADPSHELNIAVNQADYPGEEKYNFWDEVKRRKFYRSFGPPSSPYRYQSPLIRTPPYTPTKSEEIKATDIQNLSVPLDTTFRSRSISSSSASVSTPSSNASRSPASSVPSTPSKDREKGDIQSLNDKEKERDRELLRIKLAQMLHTAKVSSIHNRYASPSEHTNSTEHEAETLINLLQNDDKLLDLLQQLRKQTMKKERKREPRRDVGKVLKDLIMQFNHCLHDKLSFLAPNHNNNHQHNNNRIPTTPLKHSHHYKNRRPHHHSKHKKPKDPINFPLPEDPIYGTPKHRRRKTVARSSSALPSSGSVETLQQHEFLQTQDTPPGGELPTDPGGETHKGETGGGGSNPGSDSEAPLGGEVELSTFLVTSALHNSPSPSKKQEGEEGEVIDESSFPSSPSSSISSLSSRKERFLKNLRAINPLKNSLSFSPSEHHPHHQPQTAEIKNDYFSSKLSSIINPVDIKLSPSFLNRKPRRARGNQSRASSRYLASGRAPQQPGNGINNNEGVQGGGLDSPSSHQIENILRPSLLNSPHNRSSSSYEIRSSSPYSLPLTPSSSKNSHLDISSSPPSSPFSPIAHLSSAMTTGLSYFTRRSLLPAFDSSSAAASSSEPLPASNTEAQMGESSFGSLSYLLSETLDPLEEEENIEASELLGSSTSTPVSTVIESGTTSGNISSSGSGSGSSSSNSSSSGGPSGSRNSSRNRRRNSVSSTPSKHSSLSSNSSGSRTGHRRGRKGRRRRSKVKEAPPVPMEGQSNFLDLLEFLVTPEELAAQNQDPLEENLDQEQAGLPPRSSFSSLPRDERMMLRKKVSEEELIMLRSALGQLANFASSSSAPPPPVPEESSEGFEEVQMDGRDIIREIGSDSHSQEDMNDELVQDEEEIYVTEEGHTMVRGANGSGNRYKRPMSLRFELQTPISFQGIEAIGLLV